MKRFSKGGVLGLWLALGMVAQAADAPERKPLSPRMEAVVHALYPEATAELVEPQRQLFQHQLKPWKVGRDTSVALLGIGANDGSGTAARVEVALLRGTAPKVEILARVRDVSAEAKSLLPPEETETYGETLEGRLDLAPYRISPTETAVGVRIMCWDSCVGSNALCAGTEWLVLLRVEAERLTPILLTPIAYESYAAHCVDEKDCHGGGRSERVVEISKSSTKGFRDIVVHDRATPPENPPKRFRWNGKAYSPDPPPRP